MNEINLLPHAREFSIKSQKIIRMMRITSVILLFITTISSLGLFFVNLYSPLSSFKKEENRLLLKLSSHKERIGNMVIVKERLKYISALLANRRNYETDLKLITNKLSSQVTIDSFSASQNTISITTSSDSLSLLNTFADHVVDVTLNNKVFNKISFDNLVFDGLSRRYVLSIKADLL